MSQSVTLVRVVDQDEDAAAAAQLRDRDQRRYGPGACLLCGYHTRLGKPDNLVPGADMLGRQKMVRSRRSEAPCRTCRIPVARRR